MKNAHPSDPPATDAAHPRTPGAPENRANGRLDLRAAMNALAIAAHVLSTSENAMHVFPASSFHATYQAAHSDPTTPAQSAIVIW